MEKPDAQILKKSMEDKWEPLDLGEDKNYKTSQISNRWSDCRDAWLKKFNDGPDIKELDKRTLATQNDLANDYMKYKQIMKNEKPGPYPQFKQYLDLTDAIEIYMEIWYDDSSDSC